LPSFCLNSSIKREDLDVTGVVAKSKIKDHDLWSDEYFSRDPPSIIYELKPIVDNEGKKVKGLNTAWIMLNNPNQYNSYTTNMVKGVIAGFHKASMDRSVVAAIFLYWWKYKGIR